MRPLFSLCASILGTRAQLFHCTVIESLFPLPPAVTPDEVKALYAQFLTLKGEDVASVAALVISKAEFQAALGFGKGEESMFVSRIFDSFDVDKDGHISFEEFITGISILTPAAAADVRVKCERRGVAEHSGMPPTGRVL